MQIVCPNCKTSYQLADRRSARTGVRCVACAARTCGAPCRRRDPGAGSPDETAQPWPRSAPSLARNRRRRPSLLSISRQRRQRPGRAPPRAIASTIAAAHRSRRQRAGRGSTGGAVGHPDSGRGRPAARAGGRRRGAARPGRDGQRSAGHRERRRPPRSRCGPQAPKPLPRVRLPVAIVALIASARGAARLAQGRRAVCAAARIVL